MSTHKTKGRKASVRMFVSMTEEMRRRLHDAAEELGMPMTKIVLEAIYQRLDAIEAKRVEIARNQLLIKHKGMVAPAPPSTASVPGLSRRARKEATAPAAAPPAEKTAELDYFVRFIQANPDERARCEHLVAQMIAQGAATAAEATANSRALDARLAADDKATQRAKPQSPPHKSQTESKEPVKDVGSWPKDAFE